MPLGYKILRAIMKKCFKCNKNKPLTCFYAHKQMADGHLNKCKECAKIDAHKNRDRNIDYYRKYDRDRGNRHDDKYCSEYREKYPNKYKAHNIVNNAIRYGKLYKEPCEICGDDEKAHAHHNDYLKPLNIRWMCPAHHSQWHRDNGEGKNP